MWDDKKSEIQINKIKRNDWHGDHRVVNNDPI